MDYVTEIKTRENELQHSVLVPKSSPTDHKITIPTQDGFEVLLMQDIGGSRHLENNIGNPFAPLLYTISLMHCTPISIGQGGLGLGTMWGVETAEEFLAAAGFGEVETHRLPHDPVNAYFVART